jgi:hypothetical protein
MLANLHPNLVVLSLWHPPRTAQRWGQLELWVRPREVKGPNAAPGEMRVSTFATVQRQPTAQAVDNRPSDKLQSRERSRAPAKKLALFGSSSSYGGKFG